MTIFSCLRWTLQAHSQSYYYLLYTHSYFEALCADHVTLFSMYHAHVGFDLMTCHGALIVEDVIAPPFKYDEELVLLFADYYHNVEKQIATGVESAPFYWLGEPQSMVVNGNALGNCNQTSLFGCSNNCHHHRVSVKPDRTYRVRCVKLSWLRRYVE